MLLDMELEMLLETGGTKVGIGVFTCMEVGKNELPDDEAFRVDCAKGEGVLTDGMYAALTGIATDCS